jgi:sec-independent protein translocase protein TatA
MGGIGTGELMVVLAILLVIFGGAKLPQLARNLGQAQKEFKQGLKDGADSDTPDSGSSPVS